MRITGGTARGIPLRCPKGDATRPATDQMRERLFSSLGGRIEGARCLDLFAGTGAYGLEALSRGAQRVTFVENHRGTVRLLQHNLDAVRKAGADGAATVAVHDARNHPAGEVFDIVFCDPPYPMIESWADRLFEQCASWAPQGLLCFEMPGELSLAHDDWTPIKRLGKAKGQAPTVVLYEQCGPLLA